ncbi:MAG: peptidylprolyl isomerase [Geobacteraceae bacterium]|nr:peptidylprolyl isomerase [Geobacteraceae bacterium]
MFRKTIIAVTLCLILGGMAISAEAAGGKPTILMVTSLGDITIELFQKEAPITVKNFLNYVREGFYGGTTFHRVIPGFMVQGGGFTLDMKEKPTAKPIRNEAANGLRNDRGTIAMARTRDPDSATAQFFINLVNNNGLNRPLPDGHGYAVFGRVIKGMDVVDRIARVRTGVRMGMRDVPLDPIEIKSVKVLK